MKNYEITPEQKAKFEKVFQPPTVEEFDQLMADGAHAYFTKGSERLRTAPPLADGELTRDENGSVEFTQENIERVWRLYLQTFIEPLIAGHGGTDIYDEELALRPKMAKHTKRCVVFSSRDMDERDSISGIVAGDYGEKPKMFFSKHFGFHVQVVEQIDY